MFGRNEKKAKKISKILNNHSVEYDRQFKKFHVVIDENLTVEQLNKISKQGLEIHSVRPFMKKDYVDLSLEIYFKHKSSKAGIIIGILSMQVFLFGLQFLWLASKTNPP